MGQAEQNKKARRLKEAHIAQNLKEIEILLDLERTWRNLINT